MDPYFVPLLHFQLTYADLAFYTGLEYPRSLGIKVNLDRFPELKALKERIEAMPKISEWLRKRISTER